MTDRPADRPRVTVLAGFSPSATAAVARALLVTDPTLVLVSHDLGDVRDGIVRRTVRTAGEVLETTGTRLVHGCVACTLREDVLPTLIRLSRERPGSDIVLALPPAIEPATVAAACATAPETTAVRFDSYVTVVEARAFTEDLGSPDELRHRGLHAAGNDHRGVADVVARQVEFADTVVAWGPPDRRLDALLHRLAPGAVQVRVGHTPAVDCTALAARVLRTGRHDPAVPPMPARALEGRPIGVHDPAGEHGVRSVLFHSRRPFHPQRLHDALGELTGAALRSRGLVWIASQSGTAIGWEAAGGGIALGDLGPWLDAMTPEQQDRATPMRRIAAELDRDPYYGDRAGVLCFVGPGLDPAAVTSLLTACLLSDAELADGWAAWAGLPDPFAGFFPLVEAAS